MSTTTQTPAVAGKQPQRIEQERARRRRRDDLGTGRLRNLAITGETDQRYTYRWINDEPGRVFNLTEADDWEVVKTNEIGGEKDKSVGSTVERIVDKVTGKRAILVRKLKDYYAEDKAKEQAQLDALDEQLKRGGPQSPQGLAHSADAYVPSGGISIRDGRKG